MGLASLLPLRMDHYLNCLFIASGYCHFYCRYHEDPERVSRLDPQRSPIMLVLILTAYVRTTCVGFILTAVGQLSVGNVRLLIILSVIAVILSCLLPHTAFGLLMHVRITTKRTPKVRFYRKACARALFFRRCATSAKKGIEIGLFE